MYTKIFVENLAAATSAREVINLFAAYGNVVDVNLMVDHHSQKPRTSAFVTMVTSEGAHAAIKALDGTQVASQTLLVSEARPAGIPQPSS